MSCEHKNFGAMVKVNRIEDRGEFVAEITVSCMDCHTPFRFVGLPMGLAYEGPRSSPDGLEARMPLKPGANTLADIEGKAIRYKV